MTDSVTGQQIAIDSEYQSGFMPAKPVIFQFGNGEQITLQNLLASKGLTVDINSDGTQFSQQGFAYNETVDIVGNDATVQASDGSNNITMQGQGDSVQLGAGSAVVDATGDNAGIQTGAGNDQILLSGNNDQVSVQKSLGASQIEVSGNNASIESFNGSGNENIVLDSGASGLTLTEDGQDGTSQGGTDTVVLQGLTQGQVGMVVDANGNLDVTNLASGQEILTVNNASGDAGVPIKQVEIQFADGSDVSVQQVTSTSTTPNTISVDGLAQNQVLSYDGTNLAITDSVSGQQQVLPYNFNLLPATQVQFSDGTNTPLQNVIQGYGAHYIYSRSKYCSERKSMRLCASLVAA